MIRAEDRISYYSNSTSSAHDDGKVDEKHSESKTSTSESKTSSNSDSPKKSPRSSLLDPINVDTEPSEIAQQAIKNKKSAIKRGHINKAWNSTTDLKFWLKDCHKWSQAKLESLNAVAGERLTLPLQSPKSGEIPELPILDSVQLAKIRDDTRRYLRSRIFQLKKEEKVARLSPEDLLKALYDAAGRNDVEMMKVCINHGAPVNDRPPGCTDTALHFAAYWGKLKAVQYLMSVEGIDLFSKDEAGDTALELARHFGHASICQMLCSGMGLRPSKDDHRQEKKKYPRPWHAGELITPSAAGRYKGVKINLSDAQREKLRRYWDALEAKRPRGIVGTPATVEQLQLTIFAERVKDWFTKLSEPEQAFVYQLKQKSKAAWPKNFVRMDLI